MHTSNADTQPFVCHRIRLFDLTGDHVHFRLRLLEADTVFETCDSAQAMIRASPDLRVKAKRNPQFRNLRELESRRHDTLNRVRSIVEYDLSPDDIRVTREMALPYTVPKNYNCVLVGKIFISRKRLTFERRNSKDFEQAMRHARTA